MIDYSIQNKKAWEYNAYDFWVKEAGMPADRAKKIVADPLAALKRYANYFETYKGIRIANICGSCGKKAVPGASMCWKRWVSVIRTKMIPSNITVARTTNHCEKNS